MDEVTRSIELLGEDLIGEYATVIPPIVLDLAGDLIGILLGGGKDSFTLELETRTVLSVFKLEERVEVLRREEDDKVEFWVI